MLNVGLEWVLYDTHMNFLEILSPQTPPKDQLKLYAKDVGGISTLCYKNDAGTEICFPTSGVISGNHNILSPTHSDTLTASVVRGDLITGNATPAWSRFAIGTAGQVLTVNSAGTDITWATSASGSGTVSDTPNGSAGQVAFFTAAHVITGDNGLFWDNSTKRLGIGANSNITDLLEVVSSGTGGLRVSAYGTGAVPQHKLYAARGTRASPTAIQSGDNLGNIEWRARLATGDSGIIVAISPTAGQTFTDSASGSDLRFYTTKLNTVGIFEAFRFGSEGQFGIGGTTYGTSGQVLTSGGASAPPTWSTPSGGGISGSGTSGQVTYWNGASSITGDANFLWDSANSIFSVKRATFPQIILDASTNTSFSFLGFKEGGTSRAFIETINSNFGTASRRNFIEIGTQTAGAGINFFTDATVLAASIDSTKKLILEDSIQIKGGSPAAGKVLTATDALGNSDWETPATGGGFTTGMYLALPQVAYRV